MELCGHATLASAHYLWESGVLPPEAEARFQTRSGLLTAFKKGDWIELNFPAEPPRETFAPPGLSQALGGVDFNYVGRNRLAYLVKVESEEILRKLEPDFSIIKKYDCVGIIVTAVAQTPGFDFVSRFFAPRAGIDEDPVTGSAHCCLAPYWQNKLGKTEMVGFQASPRGGVVKVKVEGDRVFLTGQAITVLRGELV